MMPATVQPSPPVPAGRCARARAGRARLAPALAVVLALCACASRPGGSGTPAPAVLPEIHAALAEASRVPPPALPAELQRQLLPAAGAAVADLGARTPEPRFDLQVTNLAASLVFAALAKDTRYSIMVDPEVKAAITASLKDVTLPEALETLHDLYGFEYRIQGTRIFVQPPTLQTRLFQVNYPTENRNGRSELRVTSGSLTQGAGGGAAPGTGSSPAQGSGGGQSSAESSRISTQSKSDLWTEIESALKLLVVPDPSRADGRQLVVSPQSGVVVVRALPGELRQVEQYLKAMRVSVERQVMLEAKIVDVELNQGTQTGVNWAAFHAGTKAQGSLGMTTPNAVLGTSGTLSDSLLAAVPGASVTQGGTAATGLFGLAFQTGSFASLLEFLESQGKVQVLSSPRIAAINNQQALLKVGTDDFFVTNITTNISSGTNGSSIVTPSITVQPFFSGIALDVTPQIDENGNIILHVHPSVSNVVERNKVLNLGTLGDYTLPLASSTVSEADTVVRVGDGRIVAIGGLMKMSSTGSGSGMPGLSTVPGLRYLFSSSQDSVAKQELVILIKPTVVYSDAQLDAAREEVRGRLEAGAAGAM